MFLKPLGIPTSVRLVGISVQASHERLLEPQVRELYVFHCLGVVAILFDCNENFPCIVRMHGCVGTGVVNKSQGFI